MTTPDPQDALRSASLADLFAQYGAILQELRRREVVRTNDAPAGGWAEHLVWKYLGGTLATNSEKSWDVLCPDGTQVQVKARVIHNPTNRGQRQLSSFRTFGFDQLAVVLFDSGYVVWRAILLPVEAVQALATADGYVNGNRFYATDAVLNSAGATDVTEDLRRVAASL